MEKYLIEITSVPDREKLVAEIWLGDFLVAEINQDNEYLEIQFYLDKSQIVNFDNFLEALVNAKKKLIR